MKTISSKTLIAWSHRLHQITGTLALARKNQINEVDLLKMISFLEETAREMKAIE